MSTVAVQEPWPRVTADEYFRMEATSLDKHEFRDGELVSMAGGSNNHSLIMVNTAASLWQLLKTGPCRVYDSNLRVRVRRHRNYVYPDVSVICDKVEPDPDDPTGFTFMAPRLVVEVLSPSTESYDRTTKFDHYREIPTFHEYVLVSQDFARVETFYRRDDGGWGVDFATEITASLRLGSLGVDLQLSDVFANVTFHPPKPMTSKEKMFSGDEVPPAEAGGSGQA